jgi:hypothetical protein
VRYFTLSGKLYSPSKKSVSYLAQTAPRRCQAASGDHFRYAYYPKLRVNKADLGVALTCSAAAGRVEVDGDLWVANYNVFRASLSGLGTS